MSFVQPFGCTLRRSATKGKTELAPSPNVHRDPLDIGHSGIQAGAVDATRTSQHRRLSAWTVAAIASFALAATSFTLGAGLWVSGQDVGFIGILFALFWFTLAIGLDVVSRRQRSR
jgi:hypothetical protein